MLQAQDHRLLGPFEANRPQGVRNSLPSNKIFVRLDSQPTSMYQQTFKKGKAQIIEASFKPNQKYTPSLQASRMKYKTEYG
jgi:hypothetical protein